MKYADTFENNDYILAGFAARFRSILDTDLYIFITPPPEENPTSGNRYVIKSTAVETIGMVVILTKEVAEALCREGAILAIKDEWQAMENNYDADLSVSEWLVGATARLARISHIMKTFEIDFEELDEVLTW